MTKLTLGGQVVADFPDLYLGDLITIADQIEATNDALAAARSNMLGALKSAPRIIELVNTLLVYRDQPPLSVDVKTLPKIDAVNLVNFYVELMLGGGLNTGEPEATSQSSVDQPSPESENPSESNSSK